MRSRTVSILLLGDTPEQKIVGSVANSFFSVCVRSATLSTTVQAVNAISSSSCACIPGLSHNSNQLQIEFSLHQQISCRHRVLPAHLYTHSLVCHAHQGPSQVSSSMHMSAGPWFILEITCSAHDTHIPDVCNSPAAISDLQHSFHCGPIVYPWDNMLSP